LTSSKDANTSVLHHFSVLQVAVCCSCSELQLQCFRPCARSTSSKDSVMLCNTPNKQKKTALQLTATSKHCNTRAVQPARCTATRCNKQALQRIATSTHPQGNKDRQHCNALQQASTATHCNKEVKPALQGTHGSWLGCGERQHCNTLQLQHTAVIDTLSITSLLQFVAVVSCCSVLHCILSFLFLSFFLSLGIWRRNCCGWLNTVCSTLQHAPQHTLQHAPQHTLRHACRAQLQHALQHTLLQYVL